MLFICVCEFVQNPSLSVADFHSEEGKLEFSSLSCRRSGFRSVAALQLAHGPVGVVLLILAQRKKSPQRPERLTWISFCLFV